ncbi:MAG TPA: translation initiation factor IF-3, partial [Aquifex sp.]|nr:translation initiation factor IF-3 [Aquifex sp.]
MSNFEKRYRVNRQIRAKEVRVIDENGQNLGIMSVKEALALAQERGLDLIEIAPNAKPPVCKIADYG